MSERDDEGRGASPRRLRIFEERTEQRGSAAPDAEENPYWSLEEVEPHPDPSKGCVRRGLCCKSSPGWFAPGELEGAAKLLDMTPDAFVRTYVVIDRLRDPDDREAPDIAVFVPVKIGRDGKPLAEPGTRVDELYRMFRSPCVFYDEAARGCRIYAARPLECQRYVCTNEPSENLSHAELARMWRDGIEP